MSVIKDNMLFTMAKCNICCLSYFLVAETVYLTPSAQRKEDLFRLTVLELSAHIQLAPSWGRIADEHSRRQRVDTMPPATSSHQSSRTTHPAINSSVN